MTTDPAAAGAPIDAAGGLPDAAGRAAAPLHGPGWRGARSGRGTVASAYWRGWPEVRADLRPSAWVVLALALTGVPAGVLWQMLAPRADFRVTEAGPVPIGTVSEELLVADDVVFTLIMAGAGLIAGTTAWFVRRRGVAVVVALALGSCLTAVVAWQLGEFLGAGPSEAQLADVGARLTSSLTLGALPAMAVAPFSALLAYVVAVLHARDEGLGRTEPAPAIPGDAEPGDPRPERSAERSSFS